MRYGVEICSKVNVAESLKKKKKKEVTVSCKPAIKQRVNDQEIAKHHDKTSASTAVFISR